MQSTYGAGILAFMAVQKKISLYLLKDFKALLLTAFIVSEAENKLLHV
ncbi:MAG: hypothetical protein HXS48_28340 [Theionarchaea archaeon]|nr:hypothetical protein [Theionarchaea archaeon]